MIVIATVDVATAANSQTHKRKGNALYLQDINNLPRTATVLVKCDVCSDKCRGTYSIDLFRAEQNKDRWGKHVCGKCVGAYRSKTRMEKIDYEESFPEQLRGRSGDFATLRCEHCKMSITSTLGVFRTQWRKNKAVLCHNCRSMAASKEKRPTHTKKRVWNIVQKLHESTGEIEYSHYPLKPSAFKDEKQPKSILVTKRSLAILICYCDLSCDIVAWSLKNNSIFVLNSQGMLGKWDWKNEAKCESILDALCSSEETEITVSL